MWLGSGHKAHKHKRKVVPRAFEVQVCLELGVLACTCSSRLQLDCCQVSVCLRNAASNKLHPLGFRNINPVEDGID